MRIAAAMSGLVFIIEEFLKDWLRDGWQFANCLSSLFRNVSFYMIFATFNFLPMALSQPGPEFASLSRGHPVIGRMEFGHLETYGGW